PCLDRLIKVLKKYELPFDCAYEMADLTSIALSDKKRSGSNINLVIPLEIGECGILKLPVAELESFIECGLRGEE
ncbi:MAG: 3-dehydroquinate synthase, partial [Eubacteriales bacterium]